MVLSIFSNSFSQLIMADITKLKRSSCFSWFFVKLWHLSPLKDDNKNVKNRHFDTFPTRNCSKNLQNRQAFVGCWLLGHSCPVYSLRQGARTLVGCELSWLAIAPQALRRVERPKTMADLDIVFLLAHCQLRAIKWSSGYYVLRFYQFPSRVLISVDVNWFTNKLFLMKNHKKCVFY